MQKGTKEKVSARTNILEIVMPNSGDLVLESICGLAYLTHVNLESFHELSMYGGFYLPVRGGGGMYSEPLP